MQVAVKTVAEVAPVRATRNVPIDVCVIAMPPVVASAFPATETDTVRPLTVAVTDVRDCVFADGPVGLPPHPATAVIAANPAALEQQAQNSLRVGADMVSSLITAVVSTRGQRRSTS